MEKTVNPAPKKAQIEKNCQHNKPGTSHEEVIPNKEIDLLETCKSCGKTFEDNSLLKHVSQKESCMADYNENDLKYVRGWARQRREIHDSNYYKHIKKDTHYFKEQKKSNNKMYWDRNKTSIAIKRKEKLEEKKKKKQGLLEMCKSCKKLMGNKSILMHTRKYPLRGYILGVLTHTTAWDRLWGGDGTLTMWF